MARCRRRDATEPHGVGCLWGLWSVAVGGCWWCAFCLRRKWPRSPLTAQQHRWRSATDAHDSWCCAMLCCVAPDTRAGGLPLLFLSCLSFVFLSSLSMLHHVPCTILLARKDSQQQWYRSVVVVRIAPTEGTLLPIMMMCGWREPGTAPHGTARHGRRKQL